MSNTRESISLLAQCPFRNDLGWRRLMQADRALLDNLRHGAAVTDRDLARLRALVERLEAVA